MKFHKGKLTEEEKSRGLIPKWLDLQELLSIFSEHQKYAETNEMKRGAYLREYTALEEFIVANNLNSNA